ncbi:uncharacterized protein LOC123892611 isoform X2 [Trifolium pratense]|uniref:uncharacterized protein LOC123892611 isoform X2 n=1 Tax=Trifolium pratense TaxID=57577 RepID=UPI001E696FB1|nr:uncharacterized protein LOC123892611 isoform X2 [Trifolium pratense]XP_045798404.1 uncharacterized protein LOC123892611 isoform X2 [Trifolium pratense]XP_045798405.1 uncharacterized protein LOC123892611 isoform X2 [Trifolium pratense]XP_045798406.1 uncharacterized protein LOC123892611 isoform X2 [Trifolium pratense]
MDFENEDHSLLDQATDKGLQKKLKISYTREFLLSFSGLDVCKEFPSGFDRSLLSESEDALLDRQRSTGALSTHSFRRNEYSASPPTRGNMNNFSRGPQGKWDSRSSGRSDRDSDSQSEWDSDSGKLFGNQSRRSLQGPEHDGLLGSGSFPRPTGYAPGSSAPKFRTNDNYPPNRSNEPYHPPRPYKAPHSRRETNDSFNDETFGSLECTSEDRAEEERKRRASFELMRKEQTEKLKMNPEKGKVDFDLSSLIDDESKRPVTRSNESVEPSLTLEVLSNDEKSSSLSHASARPLVPPGFASTMLERNTGTKISSNTHVAEAGQHEPGDTRGSHVFSINLESKEGKLSTKQVDNNQQNFQSADINVSINNEKENILNLSSLDIPNIRIGMSDQLRKRSALSEALEASDDSKFVQLNAEVKGKEAIGGAAINPESSESILYKLFGNASTLTGGIPTSTVEPDHKADETWSPHAFQSSKFAHWFAEEEKKSIVDLTPRPNELLSLIVGGEKGGMQVSNVETTHHVAPNFTFQNPEPAGEHVATNVTHTAIVNSELSYKSDKPEILPAVLTCEDLEQSILSQVSENGSSSQQRLQDKDFGAKTGQSTPIDGHASEHLLSLLQKGSLHKDMELSPALHSTDMVHNSEGVTTASSFDNAEEVNADASNSSKTLTLETLFGSAFMKELQSVGAPLSVQRGSIGSSGADFSESQMFPFPTSDNVHPPTGDLTLNRHGSGVFPQEKTHQPKSNRFEEQWLGYGDSHGDVNSSLQSGISKAGGFNRSHDIRLPEEDSLISVGDPLQTFLSGNSAKADLSQDTPVEITRKLAALNSAFRDERLMMRNQEGQAYPRGPYDIREPGIPYQNLNAHRPSQLQPHQLNHIGPMFNQLDSHSPRISSYMKHATSEGMVHHDSPTNRQFPGNMLRPPFHQPSSVVTGFDPPAHHPLLPQMHMQGNLPPPHLLRGFPRGAAMPPHPSNPMAGMMQEPNPMQGFPFNGQQHPSLGGPGMQLQAPGVAGGRNHPEALQRLFEMELRSNSKPIHTSGHNQGIHGHELDLGFGYR